jgi:cytochrome c oxidase assembly protein subunit 23
MHTNMKYSKAYSEYYDPCQEMATRSLKCLHRNGGNREMCTDYFQ